MKTSGGQFPTLLAQFQIAARQHLWNPIIRDGAYNGIPIFVNRFIAPLIEPVVYDLVQRRWKAKLKSFRSSHAQQDGEAVAAFLENRSEKLRSAIRIAPNLHLR